MKRIQVTLIDNDPDEIESVKLKLGHRAFDIAIIKVLPDSTLPQIVKQATRGAPPDVFLVDLSMPIHGAEIGSEIRNTPHYEDIPIAYISAYQIEPNDRFEADGVNEYRIARPIDADSLATRLISICRRHRA